MSGTTTSSRSTRPPVTGLRRLCATSLALATALLIAPATPDALAPAAAAAPVAARVADTPQTTPATSFRVANFNVLGADHTAPGGNRKGWDSGVVRMDRVVTLVKENALDVVGFQEFQPPQATRFAELMGTTWQTYPGLNNPAGPSVNSIGWSTAVWRLLEARTIPIPYFDGVPSRMPAVLLQNIETGRRVWFFNTHNPADTRGPAQQWRDTGFAMEVALANELRAAYPDAPFISLGDKNERGEYYCAVAPGADLWSASGGYVDGTTCRPPAGGAIDWIMGTKDVFFNGYTRLDNAFVRRTSDHPLYFANAVVPASAPVGVDHVVVVAVPGLTSTVVRGKVGDAGEIARLRANGASTTNARTVRESTQADANLMSLLTGRRVFAKAGGHGVGSTKRLPATVHASAGQYVSGVFDLAHNLSNRTMFGASRPETHLVHRSWNRKSGGGDPYGVDDGKAKLDAAKVMRDDAAVVGWWRDKIAKAPAELSVLELSGVLDAGLDDGFTGPAYQKAVRKAFRRVAAVRRSIAASPEMQGTTLLVVTGTGGAQKARGSSRDWAQSYRVPMWVTGPGVPADSDLYDLNPSFASPGKQQMGYSGVQPIRVGDLTNLVTRTLGLPPVPGSSMDPEQRFQVFDPLLVPGA
ncbi:endonuclease/exonuclease/phosphatase family protein [Nocardioides xinjiangensis]|uniref:endonuclease/exonuclease/phosphatase family protein n=1 Tax=Nocardioides xinjiangensis TaxID=2817376 RepID=UPI001B314073|nr:endonuclease/exonuclease/phosphatase family protein [Nocardioides sp. SYSU D00778]